MNLNSHYQNTLTRRSAAAESWNNYSINDSLLCSYRENLYTTGTYPSNLHYHDYYELIVIEEGNIQYICESKIFYPKKNDIILIPPQKFHMSAINDSSTQYNRFVFYFFPDAFEQFGCSCLCDFAKEATDAILISFSEKRKNETAELLKSLSSALSSAEQIDYALAVSYILQFFHLLSSGKEQAISEVYSLPLSILGIKNFIDENYASITSSAQVAERFFYSREHASRLFKKSFDVTISHYILQKRILESQRMILSGASITDAAFTVGFNSMSAFIRGFKEINGISPSEYRKQQR